MTIFEFLNAMKTSNQMAEKERYGESLIRMNTIYENVIYYLVGKEDLNLSADVQTFYETYRDIYTPAALYRVAEYYRKQNHLPRLNYKEDIYHKLENTMEEWRLSEL
ncbi:hypothetical protein [Salinicoccus albus]|uniref:hypothetical protein n=1 Tax=Salinicoccus albus TaxID=418756 RepID=UPI0003608B6A|nr:hypothetical protein [Salinicoccus albus]